MLYYICIIFLLWRKAGWSFFYSGIFENKYYESLGSFSGKHLWRIGENHIPDGDELNELQFLLNGQKYLHMLKVQKGKG